MTHPELRALMESAHLSLYQEIEIETTEDIAAGRLADVDAHRLWVDLDEDEHGAQDDPWSTALGAITALYRVPERRSFWEPRLEQIWPRKTSSPCNHCLWGLFCALTTTEPVLKSHEAAERLWSWQQRG